MGQGASKASKHAVKSAEKVVNKAKTTSLGTAATPKNPGGFLRGDGLASQDIRDVGQEMFLKSQQKDAPQEMPADLLRFIQDVGTAKKSVDKEMTASRLLETENVKELEKTESERQAPRQRQNMPLIASLQEERDDGFSVKRSTNFSSSVATDEPETDFGISNLEFYELMLEKENQGDDAAIESYYKAAISRDGEEWNEDESHLHKLKLKQALQAVAIPVIRVDEEGNIYGLHPDRLPGPEVKSMQPVPSSKVKLVLQDVVEIADEQRTIKQKRP
jgi:hypothetical protein